MGKTHGLLSRHLRTVSMQAQGCSVLLKSIEVAQWYLSANPGKLSSRRHGRSTYAIRRSSFAG